MRTKYTSGQLRVLLIGAEDEENLAIRYLGAVLEKAGHEVTIAPCSRYADFPQAIWSVNRFQPQFIGVSIAFQSLAGMYFDLAKKIKEAFPKTHVVVGGHFSTFEYKKILKTQPAIDSVVRFEGEKAIVELADYLLHKRGIDSVTNLVFRKGKAIKENRCFYNFLSLDELPRPIREKKPQSRLGEKFATLVSSRGCWHSSCLYCCIGAFHSKKPIKFKLRNPKLVAEEIVDLYHKKGIRLFQFHDDNFMMPSQAATVDRINQLHKWLEANSVPSEKIAFLIKARPDTVDRNVAKCLKRLGTIGVFLGIENASETGLEALCRRTNTVDNQRALRVLEGEGIAVTYNLLIFHPKATPEEIKENVIFMNSYNNCPFDFGRAEVCAGTPLEAMLVREKKLKGKWPNWDYEIEDKKVERMFQIYRKTFRDKNTGYARLVHLNIALGYHAKLIERLHPGPLQKKLTRRVEGLIIGINQFIAQQVTILSTCLEKDWNEEEIAEFRQKLKVGCKQRISEIKSLNQKLLKLTQAEAIFLKFGIQNRAQETLRYIPTIFS